ncbi:hypothetical protein O3M35_013010 [Rhynocoris fuscipes]|uniref:Protein PET117 homolog, mitochondrial n=1 Tax=Rhynocoris fuscipes TaxID=488301 RepID=A0AAW1CIX1_9HEMI
MSSTSKIVFALSAVLSVSIISYVHYKQEYDRTRMREGVIRDIEQQQRKKMQNLYMLEQQKHLTSKYKELEKNQ